MNYEPHEKGFINCQRFNQRHGEGGLYLWLEGRGVCRDGFSVVLLKKKPSFSSFL